MIEMGREGKRERGGGEIERETKRGEKGGVGGAHS